MQLKKYTGDATQKNTISITMYEQFVTEHIKLHLHWRYIQKACLIHYILHANDSPTKIH